MYSEGKLGIMGLCSHKDDASSSPMIRNQILLSCDLFKSFLQIFLQIFVFRTDKHSNLSHHCHVTKHNNPLL